ncbi:MAG: ATP-dependent DNA helicase RecG [Candidatus Pacebacteria bacterium]|nr:ATP-dependent DNA helicase RecG [Candidatus Paceibacterota bacterium]
MDINSPLDKVFKILTPQNCALKKLGLETVEDLLFYFPTRYGNVAQIKNIKTLEKGDTALVYGKISQIKIRKGWKSKIPMAEARLSDESGTIKIVWLHQPYIAKMIQPETFVKIEGKISERKGDLAFVNPEIEKVKKVPIAVGNSLFGKSENGFAYPIYRETRGVTSRWIFHSIQKILKGGVLDTLEDSIPTRILEKYHLPSLRTALIWIHAPKRKEDSLSARKRFAFEEVFYIQLQKQKERKLYAEYSAFKIRKTKKELGEFTARFSFSLTSAQEKAIDKILEDFSKHTPMSRLLEGDVGSGKTAVAATVAYAIVTTSPPKQDYGNLQVAYMAPTEILAQQHFESFIEYFKHLPIQIGLITGSGCKKFPSKVNSEKATDISRSQLLKWVENGEIPILVGTHALIQKTVEFRNLAFVVIDEQHRFGTKQRKNLRHKQDVVLPHLLSMTATPIPRTLALTVYGDLDITLLDEMPSGRKPVITEIVLPTKRNTAYEVIKKELSAGRQAYVICPRIDEPDPTKELALNVKSVKEEARRLKKEVFPKNEIGILHGKMLKKEKEDVMQEFKNGEIDILVATSVIEVGVNVPDATVIIIEGAERFGLAQLHQLRGRVIRSTHQSYCFVFADTKSESSLERLQSMVKAKNGFELAEFDLAQRGSGDLYGKKQWGLTDLGMEALRNIKMVEAAREEATQLIDSDSALIDYPLLKKNIEEKREKIHFE